MEIEKHYYDLQERLANDSNMVGMGFRMLYDNFDNPDWKRGDPMIGTMTYTDVPEDKLPKVTGISVKSELDALKVRISSLEQASLKQV